MQVDFFIALHHNPALVRACSETRGLPCNGWDPRPVPPNLVCVWMDPFWSGLTCDRMGDPIALPEGRSAALFRIRGTLRPLPPSTAQSMSAAYRFRRDGPDDEPPWPAEHAPRSLCDSFKLHFMRATRDSIQHRPMSYAGFEPIVTDFLYSSGIPLHHLQTAKRIRSFGVFNYNYDFNTADPIPGLCLALFPPMSAPIVPDRAVLYALPGTSPAHHERLLRFCEWSSVMLGRIHPGLQNTFRNMRTLCRDQGSSHLFQHLHLLFDTPGTAMPLTLGPYALAAALAVNGGLSPSDVLERLLPLAAVAERDRHDTPPARRLLMRLLRDLFACFTLCAIEGVYWPDLSLGVDVEDQPFPGAFTPASRFFPKDDCEGGAARVQQMLALLVAMHRCEQAVGLDALVRRIRAMPSFAHLLGGVRPAMVADLVRLCCVIGGLIATGVIDAQTVVGEVRMACLQQQQQRDAAGTGLHAESPSCGHSFSVGLFRTSGGFEPSAFIIETTGWQRAPLEGYDRPVSEAERRMLQTRVIPLMLRLARTDPRQIMGSICNVLPPASEHLIYKCLALGHDRIYFTASSAGEGGGGARYAYGASLQGLRETGATPHPRGKGAFFMTTRDFVSALRPNDPAKPPGWPSDPDAALMLREYDAIRDTLPALRRCLRPSFRTEPEYEAIMREKWSPLHDDDLERWRGRPVAGVYFSIPNFERRSADSWRDEVSRLLSSPHEDGWELTALPFMSSVVFNLRQAGG